uniref:Uncharacterized protein n=1 Tax=Hanusia phi TaxID=3032 RepID=A0A7S0DWA0_9CRYP|mmetsp:Transcript_11581/g.26529  ORF Transcript_11581/g.26529 Transcript_11581/m.26529 type:complete len:526 (+) Transcript_11581:84-1661(+)
MAKQRRYREKTAELISALEHIIPGGRPIGNVQLGEDEELYQKKKSRNQILLACIDAIKNATNKSQDGSANDSSSGNLGSGGGSNSQDPNHISFQEILSVPNAGVGVAILRLDGTCVTVNPALLRLLPSFKGSQLSTQIISVPNGKWRQSEIGPHICEAEPDDIVVSTANVAPNRRPPPVTLDAMRVVLVSKQNAKKSFHGMGMNMGMSMAIGSLTGNLPTQFASPQHGGLQLQPGQLSNQLQSNLQSNQKMHGGGHLLPTRPLLQPGQLFQQQQQQQQQMKAQGQQADSTQQFGQQGFAPTNSLLGQPSMLSMFGSGTLLQMQGQGQSLHSSHAVNIIASPSQQMQMQNQMSHQGQAQGLAASLSQAQFPPPTMQGLHHTMSGNLLGIPGMGLSQSISNLSGMPQIKSSGSSAQIDPELLFSHHQQQQHHLQQLQQQSQMQHQLPHASLPHMASQQNQMSLAGSSHLRTQAPNQSASQTGNSQLMQMHQLQQQAPASMMDQQGGGGDGKYGGGDAAAQMKGTSGN